MNFLSRLLVYTRSGSERCTLMDESDSPPASHSLNQFDLKIEPKGNEIFETGDGPFRQLIIDEGRTESILWRFLHFELHLPLIDATGWGSDKSSEYTSLHPHSLQGPQICTVEWSCDNPECVRFDKYCKDEKTCSFECSCGCNYMLCMTCLKNTQLSLEGDDLNYEKQVYKTTHMGWYEVVKGGFVFNNLQQEKLGKKTKTNVISRKKKQVLREMEVGKTVHVIQQSGELSAIDQPCCGWILTECIDFIDHCLYYYITQERVPVGDIDWLRKGDIVEVCSFSYDGQVQIIRPFKCYLPLEYLARVNADFTYE